MTVINDFIEGFYDGPHATPKEALEGPIFLGIKNVTSEGRLDFSQIRHVSDEEFGRWTKRVTPRKDDVVFTYEATLHRYALIPEGFHGCLGRRMALMRPDTSKVNPRFLHYYCLSSAWRAEAEASVLSGATVDRIPLTKVPSFKVNFPDLPTQERIAAILSAYDDLIENNRRRIALLEQAARLLYREWFVHFRFPGHEAAKFVDGLPEGWAKVSIGEHCPLVYGKALKADTRIAGNVDVYGSSGIVGTHNKKLVGGDAIVVGRKGNVGSVFWAINDFWPIDTAYYVAPANSDLFTFYALENVTFINTDVAVPGLNRDFAHSRLLSVPSPELLGAFNERANVFMKQLSSLNDQNFKLTRARDLLLPRLMDGRIPV